MVKVKNILLATEMSDADLINNKDLMAATHLVLTSRHMHPIFLMVTDSVMKVALNVLTSNEHTSRSGIFRIGSGSLADRMACNFVDENGEVDLINAKQAKQVVAAMAELGVLKYDPATHTVYFPEFLEFTPFGLSATIIADELLKELRMYPHKEFWTDFFTTKKDFIAKYFLDSEKKSKKPELIRNHEGVKKIKLILENPQNL